MCNLDDANMASSENVNVKDSKSKDLPQAYEALAALEEESSVADVALRREWVLWCANGQ